MKAYIFKHLLDDAIKISIRANCNAEAYQKLQSIVFDPNNYTFL